MISKSHGRLVFILVALCCLLWSGAARATCTQLVYVVAHRCNDKDEVNQVVANNGVNAVEADFSFDEGWYANHDGHQTDTLDEWLDSVRPAIDRDQTLALIIFDIKSPEENILEIYHHARAKLGYDVNFVFSIGSWDARDNFRKLESVLGDVRLGFAIDDLRGDQDQYMVRNWFKEKGYPRYWYADGIDAAIDNHETRSVEDRIAQGIKLRDDYCDNADAREGTEFHGVYTWTYDQYSSITKMFEKGVNAILVNAWECYTQIGWDPADVVAHARNLPNRRYATRADNPFYLGPQITCPAPIVAECTVKPTPLLPSGATIDTSAEITSLLSGGSYLSTNYCNSFTGSVVASRPTIFPLNTTTDIVFTGTDTTSRTEGFPFPTTITCNRSGTCKTPVTVLDRTSPQITCPADIVLDPDGPSGTAVSLPGPTTTDSCDPQPAAACTIQSGTVFPIGSTIVGCAAVDHSYNSSGCAFTVKIRTPAEIVQNLQTMALSVTLPGNEINGLTSQLRGLLDAINRGNNGAACDKSQSLVSKFGDWMQSGKLSPEQGVPITTSLGKLRATILCP